MVHGYTLSNVGLSYRASFEPFFLNLNLASAVGPWPELYRKEGRTQLMGQFGLVF